MFKTLTEPLKYGYATGRIKVLETKLLDKTRVKRLVEAKDFEEARHILSETDYGEFFEEVKTWGQVEKALTQILLKLYLFLEELEVDEEVISFFRLKYDFLQLKILLKAKHSKEPSFFLENLGKLKKEEVEMIKSLIEEEKTEELPEDFREALIKAQKKFVETKDPAVIDQTLDKYFCQELHHLSFKLKNKYLQELTQTLIDLANLKGLLRAKNLGQDQGAFEEALLEEGFITKEIWLSLYPQPLSNLLAHFEKTPYGKLLEKTKEAEIDLAYFDKLSEKFLLNIAKKAKGVAVGIEPIVGYILAKENEVNILRIILKGKLKGFSPKEIELRSREVYV